LCSDTKTTESIKNKNNSNWRTESRKSFKAKDFSDNTSDNELNSEEKKNVQEFFTIPKKDLEMMETIYKRASLFEEELKKKTLF
jgi:hypothetical protein